MTIRKCKKSTELHWIKFILILKSLYKKVATTMIPSLIFRKIRTIIKNESKRMMTPNRNRRNQNRRRFIINCKWDLKRENSKWMRYRTENTQIHYIFWSICQYSLIKIGYKTYMVLLRLLFGQKMNGL